MPQVAPSGNLAFLERQGRDASLNTLRTLALGNPYEHASLGRLPSGHDTYNGSATTARRRAGSLVAST